MQFGGDGEFGWAGRGECGEEIQKGGGGVRRSRRILALRNGAAAVPLAFAASFQLKLSKDYRHC